jgi:hypothetical protein
LVFGVVTKIIEKGWNKYYENNEAVSSDICTISEGGGGVE